MGYNMNDSTANKINANTAISVSRRDASTTEAQIAAFMARTEVSLEKQQHQNTLLTKGRSEAVVVPGMKVGRNKSHRTVHEVHR